MYNSMKVLYITLVFLLMTSLLTDFLAPRVLLNKLLGNASPRFRPVPAIKFVSEDSSSIPSLAPPDLRMNTSDLGYVLATHYSDQLTGSTANVISLQCWASTLPGNIRVVEPFLHYGSLLGFNLNPYPNNNTKPAEGTGPRYGEGQKFENTVKASDLFDIAQWSNFISAHHFAPFISWSYFIQHAPKQLIIVDQACVGTTSACMKCASNNAFFESNLFLKFAEQFAQFYKFQLVRKICYQRKTYSQKNFQKLVYGQYNPQDSVVIFNHFGGVEKNGDKFRTRVDSNRCNRFNCFLSVRTNPLILRQSATYIGKYMPRARMSGYVSVMVRMEYLAISHKFRRMSKKQQNNTMMKCVEKIVDQVNIMKKKANIYEVFISTDVGKYGSAGLRRSSSLFHNDILQAGLDRLYKALLGDTTDRDDMMARIDAVVQVQSPGYVAQLERNIAANATCLVLAGGGSFHGTVRKLYNTQYRETRLHNNCGIENIKC